ncbi:10612_t:CDS:2, partial [Acaulospora colombiana]
SQTSTQSKQNLMMDPSEISGMYLPPVTPLSASDLERAHCD